MSLTEKRNLAFLAPFVLAFFPAYSYWTEASSITMTASAYLIFAALFIGTNLLTYILYYYDKHQARSNRWRIAEKTLHVFALCGGWPAALYAIDKIRHKSSKRSFQVMLYLTITGNLIGMVYIFLWHMPKTV